MNYYRRFLLMFSKHKSIEQTAAYAAISAGEWNECVEGDLKVQGWHWHCFYLLVSTPFFHRFPTADSRPHRLAVTHCQSIERTNNITKNYANSLCCNTSEYSTSYQGLLDSTQLWTKFMTQRQDIVGKSVRPNREEYT